MTKELEQIFSEYPYGSQDDKGGNAIVIAKFFNPWGVGVWLITEAEKQENGDWFLFGYCHIFEWEWGSVSLNELESIKSPLAIEQDFSVKGKTVKECLQEMGDTYSLSF